MRSRPCFQLVLQETGVLMLTAMALAPPPATFIKVGEGVPWDLLPWSQLSSKPSSKTLLLAPGTSWPPTHQGEDKRHPGQALGMLCTC